MRIGIVTRDGCFGSGVSAMLDIVGGAEYVRPAIDPSIPPFASFFAGRVPESPVGPFSLVQVRLVVRAGIRPRALWLGSVGDCNTLRHAVAHSD